MVRVRVSLAATLLLLLLTGSASGHPLSLVLSGHARNNTVVVRATGPDRGTYAINGSRPVAFARIRSLTINGHGGDDVCRIINPPHGLFAPPGGIACRGGNRPGATRRGVMDLGGGATSATAYLPGSIPGSGTLVTRRGKVRQRIRFSGLAPITDTAPSLSETLSFNAPNDTVALVSGATAGTWTLESLDSPPAVESFTFSNKVQITVNAQGNDDVVLENTGPETGMGSLTVNSSGPIIASGAEDAGIPVALSSAGAIEGAGPAPNLATAQLTATGPTGIGPMSVSTPMLAASATAGAIDLTDGIGANVGAVNAAQDVRLEVDGGGALATSAPILAPNVTLVADEMSLTGGPVSASAQATLEPATSGLPIDLGPSAKAAGQLDLAATDLTDVTAPGLTIGDATAGAITVTAPITRGSGHTLELASPAGFGGASGGTLTVGALTFDDLGAAGRPWTIGPSSVSDGTGAPIAYSGASTLQIEAGAGSDTFDVTPSSTTTDQIDGGVPTVSPGDTLTYEAGGRVLTASPQAGAGELEAPGVDPVGYTGIETVAVADRGATGTAAPPTPRPQCSLAVISTKLQLARGRAKTTPLPVLATCDQTAKTVLRGVLTETPKPPSRKATKSKKRAKTPKPQTFTLGLSRATAIAGHFVTLSVKIPAVAVTGLRSGAKESLTLTLTATGPGGAATASARVKRLTG